MRNLIENIASMIATFILICCLGFFVISAIFWAIGNVPA